MANDFDLNKAFRITTDQIHATLFKYLNLLAVYMLHSLANSQSMGKLSCGFKNVKSMTKMLSLKYLSLDYNEAPLPYVTCQTLAYAMSHSQAIWTLILECLLQGR